MNAKVKEFDNFEYDGWAVNTDLGSAMFDGARVHIEGSATKEGDKKDVTVTVKPENEEEIEGEKLDEEDLEMRAKLVGAEDVKSKESLFSC